MKTIKNKITLMQYIFLIHGVQLGVGVLTLPRELAEKAGTDGWISIIICWFLATTASLIIIKIMKKYPNGTILDFLTHYFGKWVGKVGTILFALYFALLANVIFIREVIFIQAWILPQTELYILFLLLSIPTFQIVQKNFSILGRYSELVFFMTCWTLIIYLIPLKYANWLYILPVLKEGWGPIFSTIKTAVFSFIGFEIAFFLYPYLQKKEKASIGIVIANTLSLFAFLLVTVVAFVFYSPDEITIFNEPTIEMLKVLEFTFIERLEIVLFSLYIFIMSTTVLPLIFITVFCTSQLVGKQDHRSHLVLFLLIEFGYILLYPQSLNQNSQLQQIINQMGLILAFVFPLCLWGYVLLHRLVKRR